MMQTEATVTMARARGSKRGRVGVPRPRGGGDASAPLAPRGVAGTNCCFVNFGGQLSSFIDLVGVGCGLTPRPGIANHSEALVVWGCPNPTNAAHNARTGVNFGGAWNRSSTAVVRNVSGSCAGYDGCPLCKFQPGFAYPMGFPGRVANAACNISGRQL